LQVKKASVPTAHFGGCGYSGIAGKDFKNTVAKRNGDVAVLAVDRDIQENHDRSQPPRPSSSRPYADELVRITSLQASAASPYIVIVLYMI
jgi:hypothetical protein